MEANQIDRVFDDSKRWVFLAKQDMNNEAYLLPILKNGQSLKKTQIEEPLRFERMKERRQVEDKITEQIIRMAK